MLNLVFFRLNLVKFKNLHALYILIGLVLPYSALVLPVQEKIALCSKNRTKEEKLGLQPILMPFSAQPPPTELGQQHLVQATAERASGWIPGLPAHVAERSGCWQPNAS